MGSFCSILANVNLSRGVRGGQFHQNRGRCRPRKMEIQHLCPYVSHQPSSVEKLETKSVLTFGIDDYIHFSFIAKIRYAKVIGPKTQAFYEDYFQVPFPLPKQDLMAIPSAFVGAMENWGLLTFGYSISIEHNRLYLFDIWVF